MPAIAILEGSGADGGSAVLELNVIEVPAPKVILKSSVIEYFGTLAAELNWTENVVDEFMA